MNSNVTSRAVSKSGIRHVVRRGLQCDAIALSTEVCGAIVTLQTHGEDHRAFEKTRIHGAMRKMTSFATVHPCGSMLEEKWAALVNMTFQTWLFVLQPGLNHVRPARHSPRGRARSVGVVTIRTAHKALIYPMLEGLGELCADIAMTSVTDLTLTVREQVLGPLCSMDRMAGNTSHISLRVLTTPDVGPVRVLGMTPQTRIQRLRGRQLGKRNDGSLAALRIDMLPAGAMTSFASAVLLYAVPCHHGPEVWVAVKLERNVGVTSTANGPANKVGGVLALRGCGLRIEHSGQQQGIQENCSSDRFKDCHEPFLSI